MFPSLSLFIFISLWVVFNFLAEVLHDNVGAVNPQTWHPNLITFHIPMPNILSPTEPYDC